MAPHRDDRNRPYGGDARDEQQRRRGDEGRRHEWTPLRGEDRGGRRDSGRNRGWGDDEAPRGQGPRHRADDRDRGGGWPGQDHGGWDEGGRWSPPAGSHWGEPGQGTHSTPYQGQGPDQGRGYAGTGTYRYGGIADQTNQFGPPQGYDQARYGPREQRGWEQRGWGQERHHAGEDEYQHWRHQQMSQFDRDYEEFRRHRQERFAAEFEEWRRNRQQQAGQGAAGISGPAGSTLTGSAGAADNAQIGGGTQGAGMSARGSENERNAPGISTDKKSDDSK